MSAYAKRRTFAIISHPDAGKTTLTERLLLHGGAIHLAGMVKAKKGGQSARSDWMAIEQQRGISVTSSVMTFEVDGHTINLLDTPGHKDFSEDTYRTLTAVDSAVMVLDGAKGIEEQTFKLFEVCRLRDTPILTFINKFDREARDPLELMDEIEKRLALQVCPLTWPVGMGERFYGTYDLLRDRFTRFSPDRTVEEDEADWKAHIDAATLQRFHEELEMIRAIYPPFDQQAYLQGYLTPVLFGSAIHGFGVRPLLQSLIDYAPAPRLQHAKTRDVEPNEAAFSAFVFKIQANMDKNHRDRVAFARICSGKYSRGMKVLHVRTKRWIALNQPVLFLARERELAEQAWPGDIIGIPGHGGMMIGDTFTEGEALQFTGIPSFAPELFRRARLEDPLKSKQLKAALQQLGEEGASQIFKPLDGSPWIIGAVGTLQFDVIAARMAQEYGIAAQFEPMTCGGARWVSAQNAAELEKFTQANRYHCAHDQADMLTYLAPSAWQLQRTMQDWPTIQFAKTKEIQ